jgi:hypothetical protein
MQKLMGTFDQLRSEMENIFESNGPTRPKIIRIDPREEIKYSYKRLFCEIIDVVCEMFSVRFSENAKLPFLWVFSMPDIFSCTQPHFLKKHVVF